MNRRLALQTLLAGAGVALANPRSMLEPGTWTALQSPATSMPTVNEASLSGFQKLVEACWQLSKGNELQMAQELLPTFMPKLIPLAQQPSKHQQALANLTAQGFRLQGIFALHQDNLLTRELYCKQSIQFSQLSGDQNLLIASLKGLADTYFYANQPSQALQAYQNAEQYINPGSPLLQARIYIGLAVTCADCGLKQEAFNYLGLAHDVFPDRPENDPGFAFADCDFVQLLMFEAVTLTKLGQPSKAIEIFTQIDHPNQPTSERIRLEAVNHRAAASIALGDLEQAVRFVEAGTSGAKALGSQRRYNEARANFQQIQARWANEPRVKELAELI